jgi:hypothetical protein
MTYSFFAAQKLNLEVFLRKTSWFDLKLENVRGVFSENSQVNSEGINQKISCSISRSGCILPLFQ